MRDVLLKLPSTATVMTGGIPRLTNLAINPQAVPLPAALYRASGLVHWHFSDLDLFPVCVR
jgi:hypothetical protein